MKAVADADLDGLDFTGALSDVRDGMVIAPVWRAYIEQSDSLSVPGVPNRDLGIRDADGLFHPSSHPTWSERELYEYLAHPKRLVREQMGYESRMAVTFGTIMGAWMASALVGAGALLPPGPCQFCDPDLLCREASYLDRETGSFGHVDGEVDPALTDGVPTLWESKWTQENTWQGYKRLNEMRDLDNELFAETWPNWAAQGLEYMRISGRRRVIYTVGIAGYPWTVREFHLDYDPAAAERVATRYRRVRQAYADQRPPECLCDRNKAKACVARRLCP